MDDESFQRGTAFEERVRCWLESKGSVVARVGIGNAIAPMLSRWHERVVCPDLQVHSVERGLVWAECKWKTTRGWLDLTQEHTAGFDRSSFNHYRRVEEVTGHPVVVFFGVKEQNEVRLLTSLAIPQAPAVGNGASMCFWPWDSLRPVCSMADLEDLPAEVKRLDKPLFGPSDLQLGFDGFDG